ncbi:MAG: IS5 family transposase [Planctomyces sp.]|nr:IS5 family transposase [Planctomyces sp.]
MAIREVLLTDAQWEKLRPLIPQRPRSPRGGRPPADDRACLEGILWVLKTGARWKDLPGEFPSPATCWRRMNEWAESGVLEAVWRALLDQLDDQQLLDWDEVFVDGTFSPAKKGGFAWETPSAGREPSGCFWLMRRVFLWHAGPRVLRLRRSRWSKTSRRK